MESISKSTTRARTVVVKSATTYFLLVQYHSITYESVELRVSATCSMCWNMSPTRRAFFIALLQTFLYTLSAKTMITIGVDVRDSAVFQADGTFELFVIVCGGMPIFVVKNANNDYFLILQL
jgi:hypothetical protein